jgi:hypothetical protein
MDEFKKWEDQLVALVGQGVRKHGFECRPKDQSFYRKCTFGHAMFHVAFIEHQDDFDVTADIGIRFEDVEELVNRDNSLLTKLEKSRTCTLGCEIGNLSEGRQKRWAVRNADDVPAVSDAVVSAFIDVGLPYIERLSDAGHVLQILSEDSPESWLHSPVHGGRAKRAVGMALLTQGKEVAQKLAIAKISFLRERNDFGLASFRTFLEKLGLHKQDIPLS